jgi:hypothetical protein
MTTLQVVCGEKSAPVAGQTTYQNDLLKNVIVHFIIVNNVPENGLEPSPNYAHNYLSGLLDRFPNRWSIGDKLIVFYSKMCSN